MPPPEYSTAYQTKLEQISEFRRVLQVFSASLCLSSVVIANISKETVQVEYEAEYERALVDVKDELREKEVKTNKKSF